MSRRYVKGAILILAIVILAVEGFLVYRYWGHYYGNNADPSATSLSYPREVTTSPETADTEATTSDSAEQEEAVTLVHRAISENIVRNSTYLDDPSVNENPGAILLVTQIWESENDVTNAHPIGVWYDENRGGRWAIFNQDLAPIPEGATFSVIVPKSTAEVGVHRANPANTVDNATYLDHPLANDNPKATLSVTPNWNPGGIGGTYDNHLVGVRYDTDEKKWTILNQDLAKMPRSAAFNVFISDNADSQS